MGRVVGLGMIWPVKLILTTRSATAVGSQARATGSQPVARKVTGPLSWVDTVVPEIRPPALTVTPPTMVPVAALPSWVLGEIVYLTGWPLAVVAWSWKPLPLLYGSFRKPAGASEDFVIQVRAEGFITVSGHVWTGEVCWIVDESVTVNPTVSGEAPVEAAGEPEMTPVEAFRLKPAGSGLLGSWAKV